MCGICGIYLRDPSLDIDLNPILDSLLVGIEMRGRHATGFVAISEDGTEEWQKASCNASMFVKKRRPIPEGTRVVLGHTRFATKGEPSFMENNHPIKRGPFYIIHNGHVSNDDELFVKANRDPYGEVDSEAIAARLASFGNVSELSAVLQEIDGSTAVAAVDERDAGHLVLAKGRSNPINLYIGRNLVLFASTKDAIEKTFKDHIGHASKNRFDFLLEGEQYHFHGHELSKSRFEVPKWQWEIEREKAEAERKEKGNMAWSGWHYTGQGMWRPRLDEDDPPWAIKADEKKEEEEDDEITEVKDLNPNHFWPCDNCDEVHHWRDMDYRYMPKEQITFLLCPTCAQDLSDEWFQLEGLDEDDDDNPIDNYEGANQSIIRRMLGGFFEI